MQVVERRPAAGAGDGLPDETLVERARGGDRSAFEALVERYLAPMTNHLYAMLHDYEKALDLCQDTFLRLYTHLDDYRSDARFSTWIYRIATNLGIDEIRRRRRSRVLPFLHRRVDGEEVEPEPPAVEPGPDGRLLEGEIREEVRRAVAELPEVYRTSLVLRDLEDLSYDEVARVLQVPVGTVKSRVNRARLLLRERLAPYLDAAGPRPVGSDADGSRGS